MPNTIYKELDPFFETIGLLMASYRFDEIKRETQTALAELGVREENFYELHLKIYDQYVQTFQKYKVTAPEDAFFFDVEDSNFFLILLSILNENRNLIESIHELQDNEINQEIIDNCKQLFNIETTAAKVEVLGDIVLFLEGTPLSEDAKWKILRIMQNPKQQFIRMIKLINSNLDAFKKAENGVKKPLAKLLSHYHSSVSNSNSELFLKFKNSLSQTADIYPTLAYPLSHLIFENSCYYGLLSDLVLNNEKSAQQPKETLLLRLKALSDRSKLEILCSLKVSRKYNLEIAGQLGLTAATMSHHMSVLLACGFVGVQKRDGRVYYHLDEAAVRQFINGLEQTLL